MGKKKRGYDWKNGIPPVIGAHSLAKHDVLREYLVRYVEVLTANPRVERLRLTLVDGFAGGGCYQTETGVLVPGSPLIMMDAMALAAAAAQTSRKKPFHLDDSYFFVEKSLSTANVLRAAISKHPTAQAGRVNVVDGAFEDRVDSIINAIRKKGRAGRCLFILDQYGYSDAPLPLIQRIFASLPNAEILLTFFSDYVVDFVQDTENFAKALRRTGLGSWVPRLPELRELRDGAAGRKVVQALLYRDVVRQSGAKFFTPFFIVSRESNKAYWLLHLSAHFKARDEMTKLHWKLHNRFEHYGGSGLRMLGYDPKFDELLTQQRRFSFDVSALASTRAALPEDVLRVLRDQHRGATSFGNFCDVQGNHTPATSDMLRNALSELMAAGHVEVLTQTGTQRRSATQISSRDTLQLPPQVSFSFPKQEDS